MVMATTMERRFSLPLTLRLSSFHIGSAMSDILLATVWNRVMIADLGEPAWAVGLLLALRYLLSPISIWAGLRSDYKPVLGLRRTPYIWLGRGLMVLALPLLGVGTAQLAADPDALTGWLMVSVCFLLFGIGTLLSGSTFLALVRDTAPPERQGLAVSIVLTVLILFFPISAVIFSQWMPAYDLVTFEQMILGTALISGFFWFIAIAGVEKRGMAPALPAAPVPSPRGSLTATLSKVWADQRTRRFLVFFALATTAAWLQDAILEPFGANLFDLDVAGTNNLTRIWLGMTAVTLIGSNLLLRRRPSELQDKVAIWGLLVMAVGMALLTAGAFATQLRLVQLGLAVFGAGFGVYSFGGFSLMAVMTTVGEAGAYLGMWTVVELLFKGLATFLGGVLRDVLVALTGSFAVSYGSIFTVEMIGLAIGAWLLSRVDVRGWARATRGSKEPELEPALMGAEY